MIKIFCDRCGGDITELTPKRCVDLEGVDINKQYELCVDCFIQVRHYLTHRYTEVRDKEEKL